MRTKIIWNHSIYNLVHQYRFINKALTVQFNPVYHSIHLLRLCANLVQFHNAGAKKDSVPGHSYFQRIEKFINEDYEEGETYREVLKFSCRAKVGQVCSFVVN